MRSLFDSPCPPGAECCEYCQCGGSPPPPDRAFTQLQMNQMRKNASGRRRALVCGVEDRAGGTRRIAAKHPRALRWFHWINFPLLAIMIPKVHAHYLRTRLRAFTSLVQLCGANIIETQSWATVLRETEEPKIPPEDLRQPAEGELASPVKSRRCGTVEVNGTNR